MFIEAGEFLEFPISESCGVWIMRSIEGGEIKGMEDLEKVVQKRS